MALADPQSVTVGSNTISLARTGSGLDQGTFSSNDGTVKMTVSHQYGKRNRRLVRFDHSKIAADPLTSANTRYSMSVQVVVDVPVTGYSVAEAKQVWDGFAAALSASTGALETKILGGES